MNATQIAQQETALDWLPTETKAILYYALKGLQNEAERSIWANEVKPMDYSSQMIDYYKNIAVKCAGLAKHLAQNTEPEQLSLLNHFS